jgi:hypothetical protein
MDCNTILKIAQSQKKTLRSGGVANHPKYKTIFPLSQLPKPVVAVSVWHSLYLIYFIF